jgi:hypothetical protein
MLFNIFALRQERVSLLWRAIFDLCDLKVLDIIIFYLKTYKERLSGLLLWPDIDIAA